MKLMIGNIECWIKDVELPSDFNSMDDNEKWGYILKNRLLHREDGPAVIWNGGSNGLKHREDGPAITSNEYQSWYLNGLCHRENGPAVIQFDGTKAWYFNGLLHRIDGPAFIRSDGSKYWYLNGKCHRLDGPAVIYSNGNQFWLLNNTYVNEKIYKKIQNSSKEELLVYMIDSKYKDYLPLIEYRLNQ